MHGGGGGEERGITWQLQVWDVADGSGTEWSLVAAGQGHCWQPQLMAVFQKVADGSCSSMKARNIIPLASLQQAAQRQDMDAVEEVLHLQRWSQLPLVSLPTTGTSGQGGRWRGVGSPGQQEEPCQAWWGRPTPGAPDGEDEHQAEVPDANVWHGGRAGIRGRGDWIGGCVWRRGSWVGVVGWPAAEWRCEVSITEQLQQCQQIQWRKGFEGEMGWEQPAKDDKKKFNTYRIWWVLRYAKYAKHIVRKQQSRVKEIACYLFTVPFCIKPIEYADNVELKKKDRSHALLMRWPSS
jgi:hypothetical protein